MASGRQDRWDFLTRHGLAARKKMVWSLKVLDNSKWFHNNKNNNAG